MEHEEVDAQKALGKNFALARTVMANIADRDQFEAWATEQDEEYFEHEPKVRKHLINKLARRALDDGEELPPGLALHIKEYISTKAA